MAAPAVPAAPAPSPAAAAIAASNCRRFLYGTLFP